MISLGKVIALLTLLWVPLVWAADPDLVSLAPNNQLLVFNAQTPNQATLVTVKGIKGKLLAIAAHPSQGILFGLSSSQEFYSLSPLTGLATKVSTLSIPIAGKALTMDFNPVSERLRSMSSEGQNLRVSVPLGAAAIAEPLVYGPKDRNQGKTPKISGSAYTNSLPGATKTQFFHLDSGLDTLVMQEPPNNGPLITIGSLGLDLGPTVGFEILSGTQGDRAFVLAGAKLYQLDLNTGKATPMGTVGTGKFKFLGLAAFTTK